MKQALGGPSACNIASYPKYNCGRMQDKDRHRGALSRKCRHAHPSHGQNKAFNEEHVKSKG